MLDLIYYNGSKFQLSKSMHIILRIIRPGKLKFGRKKVKVLGV